MGVIIKTGHSRNKDEKLAIKEAVGSVLDSIEAPISFLVLFASPKYDAKKLMSAYNKLPKTKDVSMIGCTTAGEFSDSGFSKDGLVCFALSSNYVRAASSVVQKLSNNPKEKGKKCVKDAYKKLNIKFSLASAAYLNKSPMSMINYKPVFIMPLLDGLFSRPEDVMDGVLEAGGSFTPIIGGVAGDNGHFVKTYQFCNGKVYTDSLVLLAINSDLKVGFGYSHGYSKTNKKAVVTKAKGRFVYKINNNNAFEEYAKLIGVSGDELKKNWTNLTVKYPLAVRDLRDGALMKFAMSFTKSGALSCAADIPMDSTVVLMKSKKKTIVQATTSAIDEAIKNADSSSIAGGLFFDCVCRGLVLGDKGLEANAALIKKYLKTPFAGFNTYGEEGYFGIKNSSTVHHNETVLVVLFGNDTIAN